MANNLCWSKDYCKVYGTEVCTEVCDAYIILKAMYSQSNIPKRYQFDIPLTPARVDLEAYGMLKKFQENIVEHIERGDSLFIWSNGTGNGKTSWACKMLNYYFRKMVFSMEIEDLGVYINVPTFLEKLRASYSVESVEFTELKGKLLSSKLVIMDDIGAEKPSEWVRERLYEIINDRDNNGKSIIYTSNLSVDNLEVKLDSRIASRIKSSLKIQLVGTDRRGK